MTNVKISDADLIAAYRLAAPARRLSSTLSSPLSVTRSTPTDKRAAVTITSEDGIVTISMGNAKPIAKDELQKILGTSKISIPEFRVSKRRLTEES